MKTYFLIILIAVQLLYGCQKGIEMPEQPCVEHKANSYTSTYSCAELSPVAYKGEQCGFLPLSGTTLWIFEDSFFNDQGNFVNRKVDTLQFSKTFQTQKDGIVWWQPDKFIGLPEKCMTTGKDLYSLQPRFFGGNLCVLDAAIEYSIPASDSIGYLAHFADEAAIGKAVKMKASLDLPFGKLDQCILFEKHAPGYRRDKVYIKPGVGVVKFIHALSSTVNGNIVIRQISTLMSVSEQ